MNLQRAVIGFWLISRVAEFYSSEAGDGSSAARPMRDITLIIRIPSTLILLRYVTANVHVHALLALANELSANVTEFYLNIIKMCQLFWKKKVLLGINVFSLLMGVINL